MARPEMPGSGSEQAIQAEIARHKDVTEAELAAAQASDSDAPSRRYLRTSAADRERRVQQLRETNFPVALRGYERDAVEIRSQAEREAERLRESAQRESAQLRDQTTSEMTQLRETTTRDAQQLRDLAARDAEGLRTSATHEADELRATARHDADEM